MAFAKRIRGWIVAAALVFWSFADLLVTIIGLSTVVEDGKQLMSEKLPAFFDWLIITPWWSPLVPAGILVAFLIWSDWPRNGQEGKDNNKSDDASEQDNTVSRNGFSSETWREALRKRVYITPKEAAHLITNTRLSATGDTAEVDTPINWHISVDLNVQRSDRHLSGSFWLISALSFGERGPCRGF